MLNGGAQVPIEGDKAGSKEETRGKGVVVEKSTGCSAGSPSEYPVTNRIPGLHKQKETHGWKEVKGKSVVKGRTIHSNDHSIDVTNGFSMLDDPDRILEQQGKGRIWIIWNDVVVDFKDIKTHEQFIQGSVEFYRSNMKFHMAAVYGLHTILDRAVLWRELTGVVPQGPWILIGLQYHFGG
ncbi:hypothetical protein HAX54_007375 [Datura stramonium]|uniref:Uncharacterized protein n=1 Tax=Datura stramonium TaxID=4076 RepID=A0ABS8WZN4_DATST|nr:hypothetical protein [Datura stramonium]